jgi:hypothetical protein
MILRDLQRCFQKWQVNSGSQLEGMVSWRLYRWKTLDRKCWVSPLESMVVEQYMKCSYLVRGSIITQIELKLFEFARHIMKSIEILY